ncbi:MAG: amidase [Parasphingorhabdus sp.]
MCDQSVIFLEQFPASGDGLRVAYKDVLNRKGEVTGGGCEALSNAEPANDSADVISALETASCRLIGRTNMHELAFGVTGVNHWTGTPINPRYPDLIPGGSSSGSAAAVAANIVDFAIGTDTGGSIRVPATCCGIAGLKPTYGRVSRIGAVPDKSSLDCIGPFAMSVDMIARAMAILVPNWKPVGPITPGRVGFVTTQSDAPIANMVRKQAKAIFNVTEVTLPLFMDAVDAGMKIIGHETANAFAHLLETGQVGQDVADRLTAAKQITDAQLQKAEDIRIAFRAQVDAALELVDALVLPSMPCPVPTLIAAKDAAAAIPITTTCRPFNLSGHPAISLPIGEIEGSPVAMQLVGKMNQDEALCALAGLVPIEG